MDELIASCMVEYILIIGWPQPTVLHYLVSWLLVSLCDVFDYVLCVKAISQLIVRSLQCPSTFCPTRHLQDVSKAYQQQENVVL